MRRRSFLLATALTPLVGCAGVDPGAGDPANRDPYDVDRAVRPGSWTPSGGDSIPCPGSIGPPPDERTVDAVGRYATSLAAAYVAEYVIEAGPDGEIRDFESRAVTAAERDGGIRVDAAVTWTEREVARAVTVDPRIDGPAARGPTRSVDDLAVGDRTALRRALRRVVERGEPRRWSGREAARLLRAADRSTFVLESDGEFAIVRDRSERVDTPRMHAVHVLVTDASVSLAAEVGFRRARPVAVADDDWIDLDC